MEEINKNMLKQKGEDKNLASLVLREENKKQNKNFKNDKNNFAKSKSFNKNKKFNKIKTESEKVLNKANKDNAEVLTEEEPRVFKRANLTENQKEIAKKYNISPMVVELLERRGYDSLEKVEKFLNPTDEFFYDPFLLKGMHSLVKRVNKAIANNEKVLIFGDYDVDGVSASAILIKYFSSLQFYVDYFLPNRYWKLILPKKFQLRIVEKAKKNRHTATKMGPMASPKLMEKAS